MSRRWDTRTLDETALSLRWSRRMQQKPTDLPSSRNALDGIKQKRNSNQLSYTKKNRSVVNIYLFWYGTTSSKTPAIILSIIRMKKHF